MLEQQVQQLILITVCTPGVLLILAAIFIHFNTRRKNASCTECVQGFIVEHRYPGGGRVKPMVRFTVDGKNYMTYKKYNGVVTVRTSFRRESEYRENDKGYLHIKTGPVNNVREQAQKMWTLGDPVKVYYNPYNPKINFVDRPINNSFMTIMSFLSGLFMIILGLFCAFV